MARHSLICPSYLPNLHSPLLRWLKTFDIAVAGVLGICAVANCRWMVTGQSLQTTKIWKAFMPLTFHFFYKLLQRLSLSKNQFLNIISFFDMSYEFLWVYFANMSRAYATVTCGSDLTTYTIFFCFNKNLPMSSHR